MIAEKKRKRSELPRRRMWLVFGFLICISITLIGLLTFTIIRTELGVDVDVYGRVTIEPLSPDQILAAQQLMYDPEIVMYQQLDYFIEVSTMSSGNRHYLCLNGIAPENATVMLPRLHISINETPVAFVANAPDVPLGCLDLAVLMEQGWYIYEVNVFEDQGSRALSYRFGVEVQ